MYEKIRSSFVLVDESLPNVYLYQQFFVCFLYSFVRNVTEFKL